MICLFFQKVTAKSVQKNYDLKNYILVELEDNGLIEKLNERWPQYKFEYKYEPLDNVYIYSIPKIHPHNKFYKIAKSKKKIKYGISLEDISKQKEIKYILKLEPRKLYRRESVENIRSKLNIQDPGFENQWHLFNSIELKNDLNVFKVWQSGITGKGSVVAVADDGIEFMNEDIRDNFNLKGSWDFNSNQKNPSPILKTDYHGTRCAGEIAGVRNNKCGVGVAYDATVSGLRILSNDITPDDEAAALIYRLDVNQIYSCSWGPSDNGKGLGGPEIIIKKAMLKGIQHGRNKKGIIYVFASGNGALEHDSCNYDGYANSIYTITVGAITRTHAIPFYSEKCTAVMVVSYSSGLKDGIYTTDLKNKCTSSHGGTSAAAPLVSGIYALVLEANPLLTWRDIQYITILSAIPIFPGDPDSQQSFMNKSYSSSLGFGKIDAYEIVKYAKNWKNVDPQCWYFSSLIPVMRYLTHNTKQKNYITSTHIFTEEFKTLSKLKTIEHVVVKVNIQSNFRGVVGVKLTSPNKLVSKLTSYREYDDAKSGFVNWTFTSLLHWGEDPLGQWNLSVFSYKKNKMIYFENWQLQFFGLCENNLTNEIFSYDKDYSSIFSKKIDYHAIDDNLNLLSFFKKVRLSQNNHFNLIYFIFLFGTLFTCLYIFVLKKKTVLLLKKTKLFNFFFNQNQEHNNSFELEN